MTEEVYYIISKEFNRGGGWYGDEKCMRYIEGSSGEYVWSKDKNKARKFKTVREIRTFITGILKHIYNQENENIATWRFERFVSEIVDPMDIISHKLTIKFLKM